MKVTDRLAQALSSKGISRVYGLQGGSVAHIFDSLEEVGIQVKYVHHEESAAFAAMADSLTKTYVGTLVVTTGPAGTNAITGVLGAWQDSLPLLVISGQTRSSHLSYGKQVRQYGSQEAPILDLVKPITKATYLVSKFDDIEEIIFDALEVCQEGRPGPVWIDIPIDVQLMTTDAVAKYTKVARTSKNTDRIELLKIELLNLVENLNNSKNPILILGGGTRNVFTQSSSSVNSMNNTGLPIILTWTSSSLASLFQNYQGIAGPFGHKSANLKLRESDLILAIGTNLGPNILGNNVEYLDGKKIYFCNIDEEQIKFNEARFKCIGIKASSKEFFEEFFMANFRNKTLTDKKPSTSGPWEDYRDCHAALLDTESRRGLLHSHGVVELLTRSKVSNLVVDGGGTALYSGFQAAHLENISQVVCASAISSMGSALAQSLTFDQKYDGTLVVIGDGSFFMALRDLVSLELNQKLIILIINNRGYLAIRHTQAAYLSNRFYGTFYDASNQLPEIKPIAESLNFDYIPIRTVREIEKLDISKICRATIVEAFCDPTQSPMWPIAATKIVN